MRVLDFLAEHGFDASKVQLLAAEDQPRAMALVRQMQVLDVYPTDVSDSALVDATLARIDRWEAASEASMRVQSGRLRNFRLSDFISVAALILVGTCTATTRPYGAISFRISFDVASKATFLTHLSRHV
jgi:hypothetical protein